jgi:hypothetical protein
MKSNFSLSTILIDQIKKKESIGLICQTCNKNHETGTIQKNTILMLKDS